MIVCRTLGPVELSIDGGGVPAELLWRKNVGLLVYLARSPRRCRAREHLIGVFWGEKPDPPARRSLNVALGTLRRSLGAGALESKGNQVQLRARAVDLDTDRLETLSAAGKHAEAAALIQGDFLEGFSIPDARGFDDWVTAERLLWRRRSIDVLIGRVEELLATGEVAAAVDVAERALRLEPTSGSAARALMRALALADDRGAAQRCFDTFVARLATELGTEPDADTKALAERIARAQTPRPPAAPEHLAAVGAAASRRGPLVGRASELERLLVAWQRCRADRRAVVALIEGDPGMGKTRLAEEVVTRARLDGARVAAVRAVEADAAAPWSGLFGLARGGVLDAPGVAGAPPAALAIVRDATAVEGVARAFGQVVQAVADEGPVVLLVDDATWCDHQSLLALGSCVRDLERAPLLLVCTTVTHLPRTELDELRVRIGRELVGTTLRLTPLGGEALRALARWALPRYTEVELDRVTRRVATDSAGIPLLAVELLHALALGLDLRASRDAWPEPLRTLDDTLPGDLPDAVVAAIRIGFRRLSANAQCVLVAAALRGGRAPVAALGRASGLDPQSLATALDELEWQRWLSAESRGYSFVARIVREVVDRDLVPFGERERVAAALAGKAKAPGC